MNQLYSIVYLLAAPFRSRGWLLLLLLGMMMQPALAQRLYVTTTGTNNNPATATSWGQSTTNLQGAINSLSATGGEVWVAAGEYKPGGNANRDRAISFTLRGGVSVYGGFVGDDTETSLSQRSFTRPSSTTLSGNLGDTQNSTDNSYHVVGYFGELGTNITLDGFVISDGQADGGGDYGYAGGLFFALTNVRSTSVALNLKNCYFNRNYSRSTAGAVLAYSQLGGSVIVNCSGCTFENNTATYGGGAVFIGKNIYDSANQRYFGNTASSRLNCEDCWFRNNRTTAYNPGQGGAVFLNNRADAAISSFNLCRFLNNQAGTEGGAIYNLDGSPDFKNCGFVGNTGGAGGVLTTRHTAPSTFAQPKFTNCSFTKNQHIEFGVGSVIHVEARSRVQLINSIISGNGNYDSDESDSFYLDDTGVSSISATTSLFNNTVRNYTGSTSFTTPTSPFSNTTTLEIRPCPPAINTSSPGTTSALLGGIDLNGNPRFVGTAADLGAVEFQSITQQAAGGTITLNGQSGSTSLCVGVQSLTLGSSNNGFTYAPYSWQTRVNGGNWTTITGTTSPTLLLSVTVAAGQTTEIRRVAYNCDNAPFYSNTFVCPTHNPSLIAGSIVGPPLVPAPQEVSLMLSSTLDASAGYSLSITWEQSNNGTTWTNLPNSNRQSIPLPELLTSEAEPTRIFFFRRKAQQGCATIAPVYSASIAVTAKEIKAKVEGKIVSNGDRTTGVKGVRLILERLTRGLTSSPDNYSYTVETKDDGTFTIVPVYWGFEPGTANSTVSASLFRLTPVLGIHTFEPASTTFTMDKFNNGKANILFYDLNTYAINGKVEQRCLDCLLPNQSVLTGSVNCPLDSAFVQIISPINSVTLNARTQKLNNVYGRYGQTVITPGSYVLIPQYKHFSFMPASNTINVQSDVSTQDFVSTTSATIVGRLTAGCSDPIGKAELLFEDVPKKGASPNVCFRRRVKTDEFGYYSIQLPARQYIVKVESFTASQGAGVIDTELVKFFSDELVRDSLTRQMYIRDVTSATTVTELNLVYPRKATIALSALPDSPSCGNKPPFKVMEQGVPTSLTLSFWQGVKGKNCPFTSGTVLVSGNIVNNDVEPKKYVVDSTGIVSLTLVPGIPNTIAPFQRFFEVNYADKYGRGAVSPVNQTVVVTGVKGGESRFQTVSPQLPYFVLHDPPGSLSYSYRKAAVTSTTTKRTYVSVEGGARIWAQVKIGSKTLNGIGVAVPAEAYGTIGGALDIRGGTNRIKEDVEVTTTKTYIQTNDTPAFVGPDADIYYGAAQNLYYSIGEDVFFDTDSCKMRLVKRFLMAYGDLLPATEYAFTVGHIRNSVIPGLKTELAALSGVDEQRQIYLKNQAKVWEDLLKHHEDNRRQATFRKTFSISGGATAGEEISFSKTKTNTYEWKVIIDPSIAGELFFDAAGNGTSGGVIINVKTEKGGSETTSELTETTTGFVLRDDDDGDAIAMDIKNDNAYATPLFETVAGQTSCPPEASTQPRDDVQFYAPQSVQTSVPPDGTAEFTLKLGNLSTILGTKDAQRKFYVSLISSSNPDGAEVTIIGNTQLENVEFPVTRGQEISFVVRVKKAASSPIFSYENLQFKVTDKCGGEALKIVSISAYFQGECSNVAFLTPEPDWYTTAADAKILPVRIGGYTLSGLNKVALKYRAVGQSSWLEGFSRTRAELNNSSAGTNVDWDTGGLEGQYDIRLELTCTLANGAVGTVYSQRLRGTIDTTPPALFGNTQPLTSTFVTGDVIGATYDEPLACGRIKTNGSAVLTQPNGQTIAIAIGCAANQITLVPTGSLLPFVGQVLSVTLNGIADVYGNVKPTPDVWYFYVKSAPAATGTRAVSLVTASQTADKANVGSIREDALGTVDLTFKLPQATSNNVLVYFSVAGTARFGSDYTVTYVSSSTTGQPLSATMNGNDGRIMIPANASSVTMKIDPVADTRYESDETVIITLLSGGDYGISAASSATATILNDDAPTNVITSVQTGSWEDPDTWDQERLPLSTDQVVLDQNHTVTLRTVGLARKITPRLNSRLRLLLPVSKLRLGF